MHYSATFGICRRLQSRRCRVRGDVSRTQGINGDDVIDTIAALVDSSIVRQAVDAPETAI